MDIPLKTLLIFGLLIALVSTQDNTDTSTTVTTAAATTTLIQDTDTSTTVTTAAATTTATQDTDTSTTVTTAAATTTATQDTDTSTTVTTAAATTTATQDTDTSTTVTTAAATTTATQDTKETTTGTFNTDTTSNSTNDTTASTIAASTIAATTTTTTQGPCASSPCVGDSTCEERFGGSFACICRPGLVYLERGCTLTKVFPGRLSLGRDFTIEMADRKSKQFQETASEIENALREVLRGDGYVNSTVLSLSPGSIVAEVQNFYDLSSSATSEIVEEQIGKGIKDIISEFEEFSRGSVCDLAICDTTTTSACKEQEVGGTVMCTCREGYVRSPFTSHSCLACPNGEKAENEESCVKCPFGFAGFNCNDPYLLVVVVVSTVSGALLIIFIVALIVVSCRNPKESSSSQVDFSSSYGNMELHKPAGVPRIPRANPDASWKSNNLEMTNSGSNQALVTRDRPESKTHYSDHEEDVSYRGQVPPVYSGYSGRGVENGGVQNPYFRQDDDRMRRY